MPKSMAVDDKTTGTPTGAIGEFLNNLPPIVDDPTTYYDTTEEAQTDVREADETPEVVGDTTEQVSTPDDKSVQPERDDKGRFKSKEPETPEAGKEPETATDPVAGLLEKLTDEDRNAFEFARALGSAEDPIDLLTKQLQTAGLAEEMMKRLGVPEDILTSMRDPQQIAGIDPEYEPMGYEKVLQAHIDKLANFPDSVRELAVPVATEAVNREIQRMTPYIDASNIETQILRREVQALKEMLGVSLPDVSRKSVMEALQDPKQTYDGAIDGVIKDAFKTAVADYKQANKPRPETPGTESEGITLDDLPRDRTQFGVPSARDVYKQMFGGR